MSAMMFPSTDPFAYPNQPMTTFENSNLQNFPRKTESSPTITSLPFQASDIDIKPHLASYGPSGLQNIQIGLRRPDDVQLFGPMPMYLMQGAQLASAQGQRAFHPQPQPHQPHLGSDSTMNFDDIFGGEEWANAFMDQGLGLTNNASFGGNYGLGSDRPRSSNWR